MFKKLNVNIILILFKKIFMILHIKDQPRSQRLLSRQLKSATRRKTLGSRLIKYIKNKNIFIMLQSWTKTMRLTTNFTGKEHFLCIRKWLILGLKAEKQLRNKKHTENWELGCYPRDNGHVTH